MGARRRRPQGRLPRLTRAIISGASAGSPQWPQSRFFATPQPRNAVRTCAGYVGAPFDASYGLRIIYQADPRRPVFTDEIGVQLSPKAATNAFARLAGKAGIGTTALHSTRHTAATHLIAGGIDVTTTAAILGHSTPTVTLSIYSHVVEGNESAAMDVLGDRLEQMRNRVVDALENSDGYRMATAADSAKKKARVTGLFMVAGTGFEPVTFGL